MNKNILLLSDMLTLKPKKLTFAVLLALLGLGYFTTMSGFEINFFLKTYVAMLPLQAIALLYVAYLRWGSR